MLGLGTKGLLAYQLLKRVKQKKRRTEKAMTSEPLTVVTKPPSLIALTATAYSVSKLTKNQPLQRFLLKATIGTAIAGMVSSGVNAITRRNRSSDNRIVHAVDEAIDNSTDNAAAVAALGGTIPQASGPLLAASVAGYAASAIRDRSQKTRRTSRLSKLLIGGCIGFAAAHVVKKLEAPVGEVLDERAPDDLDRFEPDQPYIPKKMEPILDSWGGASKGH
ncbi:hypothetical protein [Alteromonas sp. ASW11-130]|uniref:hypothetical protein n=1 Tax=Alteromonas sp. ASW11-130 TaxID=3015775 RepID=UPI00224297BB|nr:hypothetical protein [Alteromonas sp. ASW11-130]MCW8092320.1 hypothetical protein [Alteromonas sp. ASW11-130]